jgi:hypothetical protein
MEEDFDIREYEHELLKSNDFCEIVSILGASIDSGITGAIVRQRSVTSSVRSNFAVPIVPNSIKIELR